MSLAAAPNSERLEAVLTFGPRQFSLRQPADTHMPYLLRKGLTARAFTCRESAGLCGNFLPT